jgi:hypothetical protein
MLRPGSRLWQGQGLNHRGHRGSQGKPINRTFRIGLTLLALTLGALLVHGYHPFVEDAEIYLPGVEKILHPGLFPSGQEFFGSHASLTLFPNLIAFSVRVTHLPFETGLFLWHLCSLFLFLSACWELMGLCFPWAQSRWAGVGLVAALFTLPIAGTDLYLIDQYLNPRNLSAFACVFAVSAMLEKKYWKMGMWLALALCVHPLMPIYTISFCLLLAVMEWFGASENRQGVAFGLLLFPLGFLFAAPTAAYHEAVKFHHAHYILHWAWYEWLGVLAPILLLWWFSRIAAARQWDNFRKLCRALIVYELIYLAMAILFSSVRGLEALARLQPMRSLHLLYILMFLFMGGLLGEFVLRARAWRWVALFLPLCVGMFAAQRALFPESSHVEWPGMAPRNPWAQAFVWIRDNTPENAAFAIDPYYMRIPGEDTVGFRCLAWRSRTVDVNKDSGAVSMFPPLAESWWHGMQAVRGWNNFQKEDFARLKERYGITWAVLQAPGVSGLECPYQNGVVQVCRVP